MTKGAGLVQFVNPETNKTDAAPTTNSVRLQGLAKSAMLNDVTIEVTHTTQDGCEATDMLKLTIIAVTMNLSTMGSLSIENDKFISLSVAGSSRGLPTLGLVTPGSPPNATGWHTNIELRLDVNPTPLPAAGSFDVKQVRHSAFGSTTPLGTITFAQTSLCVTKWCDDDATNDDEDLSIGPNDNSLFTVDTPGFQVAAINACAQASQGVQVFHYGSFHTWLESDRRRVSPTVQWHSTITIDCNANSWQTSNALSGNTLGPGDINVLADLQAPTPFTDPNGGGASSDVSVAPVGPLVGVMDPTVDIFPIHTLRALWNSDTKARRTTTDLLNFASQPVTDENRTAVSAALWVLSDRRARKAIPLLIAKVGADVVNLAPQTDSQLLPATVVMLIDFGEEAVYDISESSANTNDIDWDHLRSALNEIERRNPDVRKHIRNALHHIGTGAGRRRLERILRTTTELSRDRQNTSNMTYAQGDLDTDNVIGPADLRLMLLDLGDCANCPADTNHDGRVDARDVVELMSHWGAADEK